MTVELASLGSKVSRITVAKYMNQLGLQSKLSKKIQGYDQFYNHLIMPNVLNREFSVTRTFKVWVSDITYIRVKKDSCI
jgi:transposase InsO family protein